MFLHTIKQIIKRHKCLLLHPLNVNNEHSIHCIGATCPPTCFDTKALFPGSLIRKGSFGQNVFKVHITLFYGLCCILLCNLYIDRQCLVLIMYEFLCGYVGFALISQFHFPILFAVNTVPNFLPVTHYYFLVQGRYFNR
jgi:hypothetical protein